MTRIALLAAIFVVLFGVVPISNADASYLSFGGISRVGMTTVGKPTPNDLKPIECAGVLLATVIVGEGDLVGTGGADLILGGPGAQTIRGLGGGDCIVGGGGADKIIGQGGYDICIGSVRTNFTGCRTAYIR